jgi:hypothetical protein
VLSFAIDSASGAEEDTVPIALNMEIQTCRQASKQAERQTDRPIKRWWCRAGEESI